VVFRNLTDDEIWTYIQSGEPMDKAGAYAIQGLGGKFVEQFIGEYDNVVGLPVKAFENLLTEMKWSVERVKK
jgi:septum formation protein